MADSEVGYTNFPNRSSNIGEAESVVGEIAEPVVDKEATAKALATGMKEVKSRLLTRSETLLANLNGIVGSPFISGDAQLSLKLRIVELEDIIQELKVKNV